MPTSNIIVGALILALAGCATTEPTVKVVTEKVEVPIAVPCKAVVPPVPLLSFESLSTDQSIFDKTRALLSDRELQLGYEAELLAALNSCK